MSFTPVRVLELELCHDTKRKNSFAFLKIYIISQSNRFLIINFTSNPENTYPGTIVFELVRSQNSKRSGRNVSRFTFVAMKSISLCHNLIPGVSRGRNLHLFNEREGAKIAGRPRQTMTTACIGSSVRVRRFLSPQPGIEMQIESSRVARGGITIRARRNGGASRARELLFYRDGAREGAAEEWPRGRGEKGKREEVNQFESPSSDPAARERSVSEIAPYSFGYDLIRYTGRKAQGEVARACARNGDSAGSPAPEIFRGFHRPNVYGFIRGNRPSWKLTYAIKISS